MNLCLVEPEHSRISTFQNEFASHPRYCLNFRGFILLTLLFESNKDFCHECLLTSISLNPQRAVMARLVDVAKERGLVKDDFMIDGPAIRKVRIPNLCTEEPHVSWIIFNCHLFVLTQFSVSPLSQTFTTRAVMKLCLTLSSNGC